MNKIIRLNFYVHYYFIMAAFFLQSFSQIISILIFSDGYGIIMFNQLCFFFFVVVLCEQYILCIIPTIALLKMDKGRKYKRYWYSSVFSSEKVYGLIRVLIITNILLFLVLEILTLIVRHSKSNIIFVENDWMIIIIFILTFGVASLMSGLNLELRKRKDKK